MSADEQICGAVHDTGRTVFVCVAPADHAGSRHDAGHHYRSLEGTS